MSGGTHQTMYRFDIEKGDWFPVPFKSQFVPPGVRSTNGVVIGKCKISKSFLRF